MCDACYTNSAAALGETLPNIQNDISQIHRCPARAEVSTQRLSPATTKSRTARVAARSSGKLEIVVSSRWGLMKKTWIDGKRNKLEAMLPKVLGGFYYLALVERNKTKNRIAQQRQAAEKTETHTQFESTFEMEQTKQRSLLQGAARWSRAERLRFFILAARNAAIRNGQLVNVGSPFGDWLVWAEEQADRLDPLRPLRAATVKGSPFSPWPFEKESDGRGRNRRLSMVMPIMSRLPNDFLIHSSSNRCPLASENSRPRLNREGRQGPQIHSGVGCRTRSVNGGFNATGA
jgi:hypothetical protein